MFVGKCIAVCLYFPLFFSLSIYLSTYMQISISMYRTILLSNHLSIYLFTTIFLSVYLSIHSFMCLEVQLVFRYIFFNVRLPRLEQLERRQCRWLDVDLTNDVASWVSRQIFQPSLAASIAVQSRRSCHVASPVDDDDDDTLVSTSCLTLTKMKQQEIVLKRYWIYYFKKVYLVNAHSMLHCPLCFL